MLGRKLNQGDLSDTGMVQSVQRGMIASQTKSKSGKIQPPNST